MFYTSSFYYLLDNYEIICYSLQQKLYNSINVNTNSFNFLTVTAMFFLGFVTSFTPCFISIFPLIISYTNLKNQFKINKFLFILGISTSFLIMIFLSHFVDFYSFLKKIPLLSSCFLLLVSLNLMQVINFTPLLYFFYSSNFLLDKYDVNSYVTGFFIGLSILPCNTSVILIVAWKLSNIFKLFNFIIYLITYLFGCFFPFFILFKIDFIKLSVNSKNNYILFLVNEIILSISGSFIFIFSLLSFLKSIYN